MSGTGRPTYRTRKAQEDPAKAYLLTSREMTRSLPNHTKLKFRQKKEFDKEEMLKKLELAETKTISLDAAEDFDDADEDSDADSSFSSSSDSEDDNQALMNELARLKKERAEEEERKNLEEQQKKMSEITKNPLLNPDYSMKVDWRDETVFRNQAVDVDETENMRKTHVNDPVRNAYHQRFLRKYVRN